MKKVILMVAMVFATGSIINANSNVDTTIVKAKADCWSKADSAEKAFCGSVGCSDDFWLGYMNGCIGA